MNLTSITQRDEVYEKHFYDSLTLGFCCRIENESLKLADIGSGAGFPSIPLKILYPSISVTIVDALQKRLQFISHLAQVLGLTDVRTVHGRAEDVAHQAAHREQYDLVTARAVARLPVLNEYCLPFVRVGGRFVAMKGSNWEEEYQDAKTSFTRLGGKPLNVEQFTLPREQSSHYVVVVEKVNATPKKYPRRAGTPSKQPL
jgi:16S rRNA (guanine527-N7)-methyltransferase